MSIAQQIGIIGNSLKVKNLPEASATTYGTGNRYFTLTNAQEGFEVGHTYKTVIKNDNYEWTDTEGGTNASVGGIDCAYFVQDSKNKFTLFLLPIKTTGGLVTNIEDDGTGIKEITING